MIIIEKRKGQVWIETVLYTVISIALIGLVLAFVTPKIMEVRDRLTIEQAIGSLQSFDEKISAASLGPIGNIRSISEFSMKRGELYIDTKNEEIVFVLSGLELLYSQPGSVIEFGAIEILSDKAQNKNNVTLRLSYPYNLTYQGNDAALPVKFTASSIPYSFSIEHKTNSTDIVETSGNFK